MALRNSVLEKSPRVSCAQSRGTGEAQGGGAQGQLQWAAVKEQKALCRLHSSQQGLWMGDLSSTYPGGTPPLSAQTSGLRRQSYTQPLASHVYPNLMEHQAQHVQHSTHVRASTLKVPLFSIFPTSACGTGTHSSSEAPPLPHVCTYNQ